MDVFTEVATLGNPVAVVVDGGGLAADDMQRFAAWTNLSETTFVTQASGAEYAVRIFTPTAELPFAGHPTLGTAWALLQLGCVTPDDGKLTQHCGLGPVPLEVDGDVIYTQIVPRSVVAVESAGLRAAFDAVSLVNPKRVDVGPVWLVARVEGGARALLEVRPDFAKIVDLERVTETVGVTLYAIDGERVTVRSFAPGSRVPEDPVCGSGNGAVAIHLEGEGLTPAARSYRASQGHCVGRDGEIFVRWRAGILQIGGHVTRVVSGVMAGSLSAK